MDRARQLWRKRKTIEIGEAVHGIPRCLSMVSEMSIFWPQWYNFHRLNDRHGLIWCVEAHGRHLARYLHFHNCLWLATCLRKWKKTPAVWLIQSPWRCKVRETSIVLTFFFGECRTKSDESIYSKLKTAFWQPNSRPVEKLAIFSWEKRHTVTCPMCLGTCSLCFFQVLQVPSAGQRRHVSFFLPRARQNCKTTTLTQGARRWQISVCVIIINQEKAAFGPVRQLTSEQLMKVQAQVH